MRLIATHAPDSSGHYRIRQIIDELTRQGIEGLKYVKGLNVEFSDIGAAIDVDVDAGTDVVILQRPMMYFMPDVITMLQRRGAKVVIDLDDDFHTAHIGNKAFMLNHPKLNAMQNWNHLGNCVRRADLITVSTDALAKRYGSHGRVAVLRNCIDDDWLEINPKGDGHTIGWAGTVANHPTDLRATHGGVAMALRDHPDWRFVCIGGAEHLHEVQRDLELPQTPEGTPWRPLELHPLLVSTIDVGIVPLDDLIFNHGKSWLKGIEYAALGIPFVASDMPEYRRLRDRYALGVIAKPRSKDWRRRLNVIMDTEERDAHSAFSRAQAEQYLTISRNAWH